MNTLRRQIMNLQSRITPQRATYFMAVFGTVMLVLQLMVYLYLLATYMDGRATMAVTISLFALGLMVLAMRLQGDKTSIGVVFLIIFAGGLGIWSVPAVFAQISTVLGLAAFMLILALALFTLPPRATPWAILLGLGLIILIGLVNLYPPFEKLDVPGLQPLAQAFSIVAIVAVVLLMLLFYRTLLLAGKLMAAFILMTLLVTATVGYVDQTQTSNILRNSIGAGASSLNSGRAQAVGDLLHGQVDAMRALAVNELLQRWIEATNSSYSDVLSDTQARINGQDRMWRELYSTSSFDAPLLYNRLNNDASLDLAEFAQVFDRNKVILVTDRYGGLVAASTLVNDFNQGDEFWWHAAYNNGTGAVYIGKPAYDAVLQADMIIIAVPVKSRSSGEVIGVLQTAYALDGLIDVLTVGDTEANIETDLYFPGDTTQFLRDGGLEIAKPEVAAFVQAIEADQFVEADYLGEHTLLVSSPVHSTSNDPDVSALGWYTVSHQPSDLAMVPVRRQTENSLSIAGVILGIVSLLAVGIANIFAMPITRLTEVADRVRGGDLNAQIDVTSRDEIGRLASTFNQMTGELRQTLSGLEQRISARTRELTLAGNVGRSLAQEHDLAPLLKQAVELIRSSFDLYYVQIYLKDAGGKALVLRAGSGDVGAELLRQGHRLQIGPGSLNGEAADRREALLVADTTKSPNFKPNQLLPETRSEMVVPLLIGDRLVGVLDMQSRRSGAFSEESMPAFQALAGQLANAVDSAALFAQARQARLEVEAQARRFSRVAWNEYLDAIERQEQVDFVYDATEQKLTPATDADAATLLAGGETARIQVSLDMTGTPVGELTLERDPQQPWSDEDRALVEMVLQQAARQMDNLRLVEQAERFRRDAEQAARLLTRSGWQDYLAEDATPAALSFVYDQRQVVAEDEATVDTAESGGEADEPVFISQALEVRGERIGEISLEGIDALDAEQRDLVRTISERLSEHLDTLRLSEQTRAALATTDALYTGSAEVVRATDPNSVLKSVIEATGLARFHRAGILLFDTVWDKHMPLSGEIVGVWDHLGQNRLGLQGAVYDLQKFPFVQLLQRDQPVYVADLGKDKRIDARTYELLKQLGRCALIFPMIAGEQWIGTLWVLADETVRLSEAQIRQAQSLVGQATAVIQSLRLLDQTRSRARREQALRQVAERVRGASDLEQVLQVAAREVGVILGRNVVVRMSNALAQDAPLPPTSAGSTRGKNR